MGKDRQSVPSMLERIASRYGVEVFYVNMDPISLKISNRIMLGKIRKIYVPNPYAMFVRIMKSEGDSIAIMSAEKHNVYNIFYIVEKMVPILEQNENKNIYLNILCGSREALNTLIKLAIDKNLPIYLPPNFPTMVALATKVFSGRQRPVIVSVCEPDIINLEIFEEEIDFASIERGVSSNELSFNLCVGSGKTAIIGIGSCINYVLDIVSRANMQKDLTIYGIVELNNRIRRYLRNIMLKHNNIISLSGLVSSYLRMISQELIERGELNRIPNITNIEALESSTPSLGDILYNQIMNVLGRGYYEAVEGVKLRSEVKIYSGRASEAVSIVKEILHEAEVIVVKPIEIDSSAEYVDDFMDLYTKLVDSGKRTLIVVSHISQFAELGESIQEFMGLEAKIIFVLSTEFVPEGSYRPIEKSISEVIGSRAQIISDDYEEEIKKAVKKRKLIVVFV